VRSPARLASSGRERGQALVEFALALPVLLILLFGAIQFAIVFNHWLTLTEAVRAGARQAAVCRYQPSPTPTERVLAARGSLDPARLSISVTPCGAAGSEAAVSATYPYKIDIPFLPDIFEGDLRSTAKERQE
jgi:Flp pilus assembly protein TadG